MITLDFLGRSLMLPPVLLMQRLTSSHSESYPWLIRTFLVKKFPRMFPRHHGSMSTSFFPLGSPLQGPRRGALWCPALCRLGARLRRLLRQGYRLAGFGLAGFGWLCFQAFGWIWLGISVGFRLRLGFGWIRLDFGFHAPGFWLDSAGFRLDFGWIRCDFGSV